MPWFYMEKVSINVRVVQRIFNQFLIYQRPFIRVHNLPPIRSNLVPVSIILITLPPRVCLKLLNKNGVNGTHANCAKYCMSKWYFTFLFCLVAACWAQKKRHTIIEVTHGPVDKYSRTPQGSIWACNYQLLWRVQNVDLMPNESFSLLRISFLLC